MSLTPVSLLTTHSLSVGYNGNILLDNLALNLYSGELVCFMGPNGIGKSSLIRTLAGLQDPLSGNIQTHANTNIRDQIAVVLTDKVPAIHMSVYELITFGRYPYMDWNASLRIEDKEIIEHSIDLIRIRPLVNKKLYQLSDGQLQMVMIARAIAQTTPVILLDEPTAHLDLNNRVEIMRLLKTLARETGKAILVATHELDLALQTADTIWLTGLDKDIITGVPEDLVLNGAFDTIFQFKGFDLRTGKVQHAVYRDAALQVIGSGHELLWTKNALERNGFSITDGPSAYVITTHSTNRWMLTDDKGQHSFHSIGALLKYLDTR